MVRFATRHACRAILLKRAGRHAAGGKGMNVRGDGDSLRQLLGVELPIIQAPMAGVQGHALAAGVSNAGGLGSLPCALLDVEAMRAELKALAAATSAPFNVNFFCHKPPSVDSDREARWR